MAKTTIGVEVEGLDAAFRALRGLSKEGSTAMRERARFIADDEAARIKSAGLSSDPQSRLVAGQIRTRSDRVPVILAGGSKKLAPARKIHRSTTSFTKTGKGKLVKPSAGDVFFGAEFGGKRRKTTQQFRPHLGRQGYWLWPTIRKDEQRMVDQWMKAVDLVAAVWKDD